MRSLLDRLRTRVVPALITAAGVTLVSAGLLTYTAPVEAVPPPSGSPVAVASPTPSPTAAPRSPRPSALPTVASTASPSVPADRVATRVAIPALLIDLPVIKQPGDETSYPPCDVAMYIHSLGQPGQPRATYLYAHAREGMFLALLESTRQELVGKIVQVWTSDDMLFLYEIYELRRDQRTLDDAVAATTEQLWLQTSEGPRGTPGKTQVIARPLSSGPAANPADAHPTASPVDCG